MKVRIGQLPGSLGRTLGRGKKTYDDEKGSEFHGLSSGTGILEQVFGSRGDRTRSHLCPVDSHLQLINKSGYWRL